MVVHSLSRSSHGGGEGGPHLTWYYNKWTALVGGLWIMSAAGISFNFPLYSTSLKAALSCSQAEVDLIATASNIGNNLGLPAGFLSLIVPEWALLLSGATMNVIGYGALWLVASQRISPLPLWQILFYQWLAPTGATLLDTAALVVCVHNLPRARGSIVGLLMGLIGLSGAIYEELYEATFSPTEASFLFMAAVGPALTVLIATPMLRSIPAEGEDDCEDAEEETGYVNFCFAACFGLALYLSAAIVVEAMFPLQRVLSQLIVAGMLIILFSPLAIPFKLYVIPHWKNKKPRNIENGPSAGDKDMGGGGENPQKYPSSEYSWTRALRSFLRGRIRKLNVSIEEGFGAQLSEVKGETKASSTTETVTKKKESLMLNVPKTSIGVMNGVGVMGLMEGSHVAVSEEEEHGKAQGQVVGVVYSAHVNGMLEETLHVTSADRITPLSLQLKESTVVATYMEPSNPTVKASEVLEGYTTLEALNTLNFWLLFLSMLFGVGSTATVINNLEAIAEALKYTNSDILVSLISIWNFMGRVLGGFYSDYVLKKSGQPRFVLLAACHAWMVGGYLLVAFPFPGSLYVALLIIGGGLGATDSLIAAATSEMFGLRSFGLIYNVVTSAPALGSYLFATLLAGTAYDNEAWIQPGTDVERCFGAHCFRLAFIVMAGVAALGAAVNVWLARRTAAFYREMARPPMELERKAYTEHGAIL